MSLPNEKSAKLARLVGGDTTGHTKDHTRHGHIVPRQALYAYPLGYSYAILPSAISSKAIVR